MGAERGRARADLDAVRTAQGVAYVRDGKYLSTDQLVAKGLLPTSSSVGAVTNAAGDCWVGGSKSAAGTSYFTTSRSSAIVDDAGGAPDTTWCTHSQFALAPTVTNLSPTPSFETASATTTVRTNLALNPGFETVDTAGNANGATHVRSADAAINGGYGVRFTAPANGIPDSGGGLHSEASVTAGLTYTYSVSIRAVTAGTYNMYLGGNSDNGSSRDYVTLAAGEVGRLSLTKTALGTGTSTWWVLRGFDQQNSVAVFDLDNVLIEASPKLGTFFSGSTAAAGDFTYAWAGVAQESASVQSALGASQPHGSSAPTIEYLSSAWASTGSKSVAVSSSGPGNPHTSFPLVGAGVPGRQYTALLTAHTDTDMTTSVIGIQEEGGAYRWLGQLKAHQVAVTAGDHDYRVTFTVPADSTPDLRLILRPGAQVGQTVYYDDFMLVEGAYTGPHLDGSNTGWSWSGAAGSSKSTGPGVKVP